MIFLWHFAFNNCFRGSTTNLTFEDSLEGCSVFMVMVIGKDRIYNRTSEGKGHIRQNLGESR